MKLFLDQFKIRSVVLNSELPANARCHAVNEFNKGAYDIIIASDEKTLVKPGESAKSKTKDDTDYGVSRGIDFRCVSNVINFDFPLDVNSYIHRAGRTARGNNEGNVLSFVSAKEHNVIEAVEEHLAASYSNGTGQIIQRHEFKLEDVEPFKYRANDAWFAVTKSAIKEARLKEIKKEICNSEKLKTFFENSPREMQVIRHDAPLNVIRTQEHLAEVPEYIVPKQLKNVVGITTRKRKHYQPKNKNQKSQNKSDNALSFEKIDYGKKRRKI